jgi:hypothetical protein
MKNRLNGGTEMTTEADQLFDLLEENMQRVAASLKWVAANTQIIIAAQFTSSGKSFNENEFQAIDREMKKKSGWFTALSRDIRYCLDALLLTNGHGNADVSQLFADYQKLVKSGFLRQQQTYLAAAILAGQGKDPDDLLVKAVDLYKLLKKKHFILTNKGDISLILLLAQRDEPAATLVEREEFYFDSLGKYGFHNNNDLQTLSCMLAFMTDDRSENLVDKCVSIKSRVRDNQVRVTASCYPVYGILALLNDEKHTVGEVIAFYQALREKRFSHFIDKSFYFQTAVFLYTRLQFAGDKSGAIDPALLTMADTLIRVQEAAQVAAIAASTSAVIASGSSNGN